MIEYPKKSEDISQKWLDLSVRYFPPVFILFDEQSAMTDQQLQAIGEAQLILEEYFRSRPKDNVHILGILERSDLIVAVSRLQQRNGWGRL
ncbi:hypothetical protein [Bradyrhizobium neotropicale]|uniref:hypothetical protein n=1 Tax=Bradyrhizobium neotropicale TaxID=1497615 RepID=UPI001AD732D4|nr:hypothetical protein [Bradyrhizobium neotropicale]MBO4227968.1 hypothetical protein [Bradyrhizobium neotropicale]